MNELVVAWLRQWEVAINATDFEAGRTLFSQDVVSFGTLIGFMVGLDALESEQWRRIWPTIRRFRFVDARVLLVDARSAVVASRWQSEGRTPDGGWYDRSGRATLALRLEDAQLRCCHSHLSMDQGIPARLQAESGRTR